jgi:hypothetical protein
LGCRGALEKELLAMCDYSLHGVSSRPAKVGDKLVTTQFWNTSTLGFSAADEPRVAVCLLPGTEVAFENKIERHLTGFQLFLTSVGGGLSDLQPGQSSAKMDVADVGKKRSR